MPQTLKAADKEFLVDDHDDSGKQKLYKPHGNVVVVEPCRERPAPHHVSHGEIHEDNEKACRGDQPVFESRCLVVFECFFSLGHGNLFFVGSFE